MRCYTLNTIVGCNSLVFYSIKLHQQLSFPVICLIPLVNTLHMYFQSILTEMVEMIIHWIQTLKMRILKTEKVLKTVE